MFLQPWADNGKGVKKTNPGSGFEDAISRGQFSSVVNYRDCYLPGPERKAWLLFLIRRGLFANASFANRRVYCSAPASVA